MQTQIRLVAVAAALLAAGAAQAGVSFDANLEHDVLFKGKQGATSSATSNSGRVELNANAALVKSGDNFVNAKASLIVPTGSGDSVGIDDAWIQFGNSAADLKIGRHEAADLFHWAKMWWLKLQAVSPATVPMPCAVASRQASCMQWLV